MAGHKQSVSFTDSAFDYARGLVEDGEYPNVSAAVSGELTRAKAARDRDERVFEAELRSRLSLPTDQWQPIGDLGEVTDSPRSYLSELERDRRD